MMKTIKTKQPELVSLKRIMAIVVRHFYNFKHNMNKLSDAIYWPLMDLVIWGISSKWLENNQAQLPHVVLMLLTGVVFWQVVWRSNYEIGVNLLEEVWSSNLANLFSTPLKIGEWIIAVMVLGVIKNILTILVGVGGVYVLYSLNILTIGWSLIPFFAMLLVSGWFLGFLAAGVIMKFGQKVETIAWTMGYLLAPFSAVYYPVEALPDWAEKIAYCLPTMYIFEGMRGVILDQTFNVRYLLISFLLNAFYLSISIFFFVKMFKTRLKTGLLQLD